MWPGIRHFGFRKGGTDFFLGDDSFTLDGKPWPVPKDGFYVTTALTDYAVRFIRDEKKAHPEKPFFLQPWQLYDLARDRSETCDLSQAEPKRLQQMLALQKAFCERPDVRLRLKPGEIEPVYAPVFDERGNIGPAGREQVGDPGYAMELVRARAQGRQLSESDTEALRKKLTEKKARRKR
jgi:hypothetical protein